MKTTVIAKTSRHHKALTVIRFRHCICSPLLHSEAEYENLQLYNFVRYQRLAQRLTAVGIRCADHVTPLYPQKLALTSPTSGGYSVGIVRSRTKATEFYQFLAVGLLKIHQDFWHMTLCHRAHSSCHFEESQDLHLQDKAIQDYH